MEHASTVDIGARKRQRGGINEDSVATAVLENHHRRTGRSVGVFVLGDGVGGEASGDVASFLATTIVRQRLVGALSGDATDLMDRFDVDAAGMDAPTASDAAGSVLSADRIRSAIQEAVDAAHEQVQTYAREIGARPATTLVVAVYADGVLHYGWVGDSRLYVINAEHDTITQLTRDHAVTNEMLERGEIEDEAYARVHEDATAITNVVGGSGHGKPTVDVEFGSTEVFREDVLLLTSDGLIDAYPDVGPLRRKYQQADDEAAVRQEIRETLVTDDEIRDLVLEAPDLHAAVGDLIDFANDRGGKDNLSITLASDPAAEPSPDTLPDRAPEPVSQRTTAIDPGEEGAADTDGGKAATADAGQAAASGGAGGAGDSGGPDAAGGEGVVSDLPPDVDVVSVGAADGPSAALAIPRQDLIVEVGGQATLGSADAEGDPPDVPLDVAPGATVERINAVVEVDEDAGTWRVRDTSSSGTYVEIETGEWLLLLSSEGAKLHREHGFDPGAATERDISEAVALEDGTAFTLGDPREDDAVTCTFYADLADAAAQFGEDAGNGAAFQRFLT